MIDNVCLCGIQTIALMSRVKYPSFEKRQSIHLLLVKEVVNSNTEVYRTSKQLKMLIIFPTSGG